MASYLPIAERRRNTPFSPEQREWQVHTSTSGGEREGEREGGREREREKEREREEEGLGGGGGKKPSRRLGQGAGRRTSAAAIPTERVAGAPKLHPHFRHLPRARLSPSWASTSNV